MVSLRPTHDHPELDMGRLGAWRSAASHRLLDAQDPDVRAQLRF